MNLYLFSFVSFIFLSSVYGRCCLGVVKSGINEAIINNFNKDFDSFTNEFKCAVEHILADLRSKESYMPEGEIYISNVTPYIIGREYIANSFSVSTKTNINDNEKKLNEKILKNGIKSLSRVKKLETFFDRLSNPCFLLMKEATYYLKNGSLTLPIFYLLKIPENKFDGDGEKAFFEKLIEEGSVNTVYKIGKNCIEKELY